MLKNKNAIERKTETFNLRLKPGNVTVTRIGTSNNISIVIPVRQGMPDNLESVLNQLYTDFELIVIAGRGTPSSSSARNLGIALSYGKSVIFLDDDAYPEPDWLQNLFSAYESTSGDIIDSHEKMHEASKFSGYSFEPRTLVNLQKKSTANFALFPKTVFKKVGLYDEHFKRFGFNEIDFSIKARRSGFIIRHCSKAVVEHRSEQRKLKSFFNWNLCYFSLKHPLHAFTLFLAYIPLVRKLWAHYLYQNFKI